MSMFFKENFERNKSKKKDNVRGDGFCESSSCIDDKPEIVRKMSSRETYIKPSIPLLFIQEDAEESCFLCQKEISSTQSSATCTNECGINFHLDCLVEKESSLFKENPTVKYTCSVCGLSDFKINSRTSHCEYSDSESEEPSKEQDVIELSDQSSEDDVSDEVSLDHYELENSRVLDQEASSITVSDKVHSNSQIPKQPKIGEHEVNRKTSKTEKISAIKCVQNMVVSDNEVTSFPISEKDNSNPRIPEQSQITQKEAWIKQPLETGDITALKCVKNVKSNAGSQPPRRTGRKRSIASSSEYEYYGKTKKVNISQVKNGEIDNDDCNLIDLSNDVDKNWKIVPKITRIDEYNKEIGSNYSTAVDESGSLKTTVPSSDLYNKEENTQSQDQEREIENGCRDNATTDISSNITEERRQSPDIDTENVDPGIEYIILRKASRKGRPKLFDSLGNTYIINRVARKYVYWCCTKPNGHKHCAALIQQSNERDLFFKKIDHSHSNGNLAQFEYAKKAQKIERDRAEMNSQRIKKKKKIIAKKYMEFLEKFPEGTIRCLMDKVNGYTYKLQKTTERTSIWVCINAEEECSCSASIKQLGSYYINSKEQHNHPADVKIHLDFDEPMADADFCGFNQSVPDNQGVSDSENSSFVHPQNEDRTSPKHVENKVNDPKVGIHCFSSSNSTPERHPAAIKGKEKDSSKGIKFQLSDQDEMQVVKYIKLMSDSGQVLNCKIIHDTINNYLDSKGGGNSVDVKVSRKWIMDFMKQYKKELKLKSHNTLNDNFLANLKVQIKGHNVAPKRFFSSRSSTRTFNCDFTDLSLMVGGCNDKLSVICCIGADGSDMKPVLIDKGGQLSKCSSKNLNYDVISSEDGNVNSSVFYSWLSMYFLPHLNDKKIGAPVLLLLKGSHNLFSWDCLEFAKENGIITFHIPKKVNKPLDVSVFNVLKMNFKTVLEAYTKDEINILPFVKCPEIFKQAYDDIDISELSKNTFKSIGLCIQSGGNVIPCNSKKKISDKLSSTEVTEQCNPELVKDMSPLPKPSDKESSVNGALPGVSLRDAYRLALEDVEKLFVSVVDPSIIELYRHKHETMAEYPDTTYLVWRGLQELKEVSSRISSQ